MVCGFPQGVRLCKRVKKRLSCLQIARVEPFGEPDVDRPEQRHRIGGPALIAQQPGQAGGGAQFQGEGALPTRPVKCLPKMILGSGRCSRCGLREKKLALDAQ